MTRNESAVIAFRMPEKEITGYQIMASHSDSPAFKIKERPEMVVDGHYVKLNVEKYGGMLMAPWFDRPLSVSGRAEFNNYINSPVAVYGDELYNLPFNMNTCTVMK